MVTVEEAKAYLRIDGNEEDELITCLIASADQLCKDIVRDEKPEESVTYKMAVLFAVAYLYEHREDADYHNLLLTLRALLFGERRDAF